MRLSSIACVLATSLLLTGCPPAPVAPAPPLAEGLEGEPCAIGDRAVRKCGVGLACVPRTVVPQDPADRHMVSAEGAACGGVGDIPCGEGLGCQLANDDVMAANAMGHCQQESLCAPAAE
ncbi:MAG TPA: hypothetical protein VLT33_02760 [Labilithrix sp.]|nr:hypothetical protein [Labilithrix sp.]